MEIDSVPSGEKTSFTPSLAALAERAGTNHEGEEQETAVFLANPCNPSGGLLDKKELFQTIKENPGTVWILDESFIDYTGGKESLLPDAATLPNLVILRSLTKFYGMAGVRCGFAVSCALLAERLRKNLPAWNVNVFAAAAVRAILKQPSSWAEQERTLNRRAGKTCSADCPRCRELPFCLPAPTSFSSAFPALLPAWLPCC